MPPIAIGRAEHLTKLADIQDTFTNLRIILQNVSWDNLRVFSYNPYLDSPQTVKTSEAQRTALLPLTACRRVDLVYVWNRVGPLTSITLFDDKLRCDVSPDQVSYFFDGKEPVI